MNERVGDEKLIIIGLSVAVRGINDHISSIYMFALN